MTGDGKCNCPARHAGRLPLWGDSASVSPKSGAGLAKLCRHQGPGVDVQSGIQTSGRVQQHWSWCSGKAVCSCFQSDQMVCWSNCWATLYPIIIGIVRHQRAAHGTG